MLTFFLVLACLPPPAARTDESGSPDDPEPAEDTGDVEPAVAAYANCEQESEGWWTETGEWTWFWWTVFDADGHWVESIGDADADGVAETGQWVGRDEDGRYTTWEVDDDDRGITPDYSYRYERDVPPYAMVVYGDWDVDGTDDEVWYYTNDAAGHTIRIDYDGGVDGDFDSIGEHLWTEQDGGWLELAWWDNGKDGRLDHVEESEWDANDLLVEYRDDEDADGSWESMIWYEYGDAGVASAYEFEKYVDDELDYDGRFEYFYDELGRVEGHAVDYFRDGRVEFMADFTYDCE